MSAKKTKKSKDPGKKKKVEKSAKGPQVSNGGSLLSGKTDEKRVVGVAGEVGTVNATGGITNEGVGGNLSGSVGEVSARVGRDSDFGAASVKAAGPNGEVKGYLGWDGLEFGADGSLADVGAEGRLGRAGTDKDANVTGGLEAGGGAKAKFGLNLGRDTDGDGVPNYGFNVGLKLGVGAELGVDVEKPWENIKDGASYVGDKASQGASYVGKKARGAYNYFFGD